MISSLSLPEFQSTPAIAGRRMLHSIAWGVNPMVSIHSGHCWPENHLGLRYVRRESVSIHSGHCWPENWWTQPTAATGSVFQSTPAIAGRRMSEVRHIHALDTVSIHSGHCWPENAQGSLTETRGGTFQSTPAIAGRRIRGAAGHRGGEVVSIHSGHCWPENDRAGDRLGGV